MHIRSLPIFRDSNEFVRIALLNSSTFRIFCTVAEKCIDGINLYHCLLLSHGDKVEIVSMTLSETATNAALSWV